jgi:cytochrome c peroxidase
MKGNMYAMKEDEKRGALLFFGKAECSSCHTGPALNSMNFYALGMGDFVDCPEPTLKTQANDSANLGRGSFTGNPADHYKFKVPQLYNLKDAPFYGHGGSLRTIRQVLQYKNNAIIENPRVPKDKVHNQFTPLGLTNDEINDLEAFLSKSLYDYNLTRYIPSSLPTGQCFPNADPQSRVDLHCN